MIFKACMVMSILKNGLEWFTVDRLTLIACGVFLLIRPVIRWWQRW